MNTKLTLRIDDSLVRQAKFEAKRRAKSVSPIVRAHAGRTQSPSDCASFAVESEERR